MFCEFGFSQVDINVKIFYSCCVQCGLDAVQEDIPDDTYFMFATLEDIERAGEDGRLYFHHGMRTEESVVTTEEIATQMTQVLTGQGMDVEWSGNASERFKVLVDQTTFADLAIHLNDRMKSSELIPETAIAIDAEYDGYKIMIWLDPHGDWCFDIQDPGGEHTRGKEASRDEAVKTALQAVETLHLNIN